ncbi:23S rRNA pseudouridine2605 synthase [Arenibacter nanhaiticus]|uniref:23S rRNA pseudouridine2605 synthase n=1 Tax=Arenibacter nanhaiticus TaxID=558155 RepID=A0A1M6I3Q7_9FLAO|nr:pseudouridine synthase [Arenibacter nanhaiticus]SHJ29056.1 23S rRNA pseudouridine2605 synthase [Arenibacter nanhaiticus]
MSRSESNNDKKASGRQGGNFKKKSHARGNAPLGKSNARGKAPIGKKEAPKRPSDPNTMRLNRYVANSGVCSRRDADIYISAGNVTVNGKPITEMGFRVKLTDVVKFDGRLLNPEKREYVLLNKPKDFVTSAKDERGRRTAASLISSASKSKLSIVGKMDNLTTGLVLFTNDGELTKRLTTPKNGLRKIFHVELNKNLRGEDLLKIKEGVMVDESIVRVDDISFIENASKKEVGIELKSTRNNIVRRIFEQLEYEVVKMDRVVYAGLTKKDLPRGHWRYLTEQEIINLGMIR